MREVLGGLLMILAAALLGLAVREHDRLRRDNEWLRGELEAIDPDCGRRYRC